MIRRPRKRCRKHALQRFILMAGLWPKMEMEKTEYLGRAKIILWHGIMLCKILGNKMSDSLRAFLAGVGFFAALFGGVAIMANLYGLPDAPGTAETFSVIGLAALALMPVVMG